MTCEVDHCEQKIAEFLELSVVFRLRIELGKFLMDLCPWPRGIRPIKADACGASLELSRAFKSR